MVFGEWETVEGQELQSVLTPEEWEAIQPAIAQYSDPVCYGRDGNEIIISERNSFHINPNWKLDFG